MTDLNLKILYHITLFLCFVAGGTFYKKFDHVFKIIFYWITIEFIVELTCFTLSLNKIPNLTIYAGYALIEFLMLLFISYKMTPSKFMLRLNITFGVLFILFFIFNRVYSMAMNERMYSLLITESILLIVVSAATLIKLTAEINPKLIINSHFIFMAAVLLFFSIALYFYTIKAVITDEEYLLVKNYIWKIHSFINIVFHLIIILAMWFNYRQIK